MTGKKCSLSKQQKTAFVNVYLSAKNDFGDSDSKAFDSAWTAVKREWKGLAKCSGPDV